MTGTCTLDCTAAGGDVIALPVDLLWDDEGAWLPVAAVDTTTITGAVVRQVSAVQAGRPITLVAKGDQDVWLSYGEVDALRSAAAANLDTAMTLTLIDGRTFSVLWRHTEKAVEFGPVQYVVDPDPGFMATRAYTLTLRLMQA